MRLGDIPLRVEGEPGGDGLAGAGVFAGPGPAGSAGAPTADALAATADKSRGLGGGVAALLAELAELL